MIKISLLIFLSILLVSCGKENDVRGQYTNESGESIKIDCGYHFYSNAFLKNSLMPKSGDKIELTTNQMNAAELTVTFDDMDGMISPFGKWNKSSDELTVNGLIFIKEQDVECK